MSDENMNENTNLSENNGVSIKKLDVGDTLKEGIDISLKNTGPIVVNLLLWIITIWIPYLNIGTTIGLFVGIVSKISREETISFTEVFDPKYRKYMGEFLLTTGLILTGTLIGFIFFIIPGFIISIAWSFALLLAVDKGKNPSEALTVSNNITYGNKGVIFLINLIVLIIFSVIQTILNSFDNDFASFLTVIASLFMCFISLGITASIYKQLAKDV